MPAKRPVGNYKPKTPLFERLDREHVINNSNPHKASLSIKENFKRGLANEIIKRKQLENQKTAQILEKAMGTKYNKKRDFRTDIVNRFLDELQKRNPQDVKLKDINKIKGLNLKISDLIESGKLTNAPYFEKIKAEYTSGLIRTIKKAIDNPGSTYAITKYLELLDIKISQARERQEARKKLFK